MSEQAPMEQYIEHFMRDSGQRESSTKEQPPDFGPGRQSTHGSKYHKGWLRLKSTPTKYLCIKCCFPILKKVCRSILQKENSSKKIQCWQALKSILKYKEKKSILAKFYLYLVKFDKKLQSEFLKKFYKEISIVIDNFENSESTTDDLAYKFYILRSVLQQVKKVEEKKEKDWIELWRITQRIETKNLCSFVNKQDQGRSTIKKIKQSESYYEFLEEIEKIRNQASQWSRR